MCSFLIRNSSFYNLPAVSSKRAAGIGFGAKYDFTKSCTGDVPFYSKANTSLGRPGMPFWTFGESRSKFKKVYLESNNVPDERNPGPGAYNCPEKFAKEAKKFTMSGRNQNLEIGNKKNEPGPNQYNLVTFNPEGKYLNSKWRSLTGIVWGADKSNRHKQNSGLLTRRRNTRSRPVQNRKPDKRQGHGIQQQVQIIEL